jgi:hypothetical protein
VSTLDLEYHPQTKLMQTQRNSRRQIRRRSSLVITAVLLALSAFISVYFTQSMSGIIALFVTSAVLELILVNCKSPSIMPRIGGIPWLFWICPILLALLGVTMTRGAFLFDCQAVAFAIGTGIVSAVVIAIVRWFHFHYHDVALYEVLSRRGLRKFMIASAEQATD